jgi:hypothetical protein
MMALSREEAEAAFWGAGDRRPGDQIFWTEQSEDVNHTLTAYRRAGTPPGRRNGPDFIDAVEA